MIQKRRVDRIARKEAVNGYVFALPWLLGFFIFMAWPIVDSFYLSFTSYNMLQPPKWIGFLNYKILFTQDKLFPISLYNTLYYVVFSLPISIILGIFIAVLMNQKVPGIKIFRTIYYLPNVVSAVAVSLLWQWIFDPNFGLVNTFLAQLGIEGPGWLMDESWSKPALIIMSLWGVGGSMIIYLAGLQDIPISLYEAATIDGANSWKQFWKITLPMLSPTIFFNLITGIIGGFQVFTQAYIMTAGGPVNSTLFYALYLYRKAFQDTQMGYASAMAWILLIITLLLTILVFKTSNKWVYYENGEQ
ncbi:carbohydrate ABC transporter permease [Mahella australiensis]|uniref:Carbohydrate ABC transporter membrane protein 1, CUT1 family n=1 Tax=Mahella australiensis (strain DSM 15567 / CIP 107919 / 50-1 BON) TaxID=697281 RepID=F4A165_MAHA5|nr:sugar ABC transporter permease [Mahella australiensis]AEE95968.1 carbohydrate ABC transporter membrane protein 1, CUT1 family [Mahella australiensis 50-1 BON]